ncbi:hypothetical protein [Muricoccus aerilatus]|uniref:hypothetical protein n=1 Tax=Muricoccus aerilatus TaxID=452982 RepID=UPI000B08277D|nr:hypothetical protein [Roseomonas aerilata]
MSAPDWQPGQASALFPPAACFRAGAMPPLSIASHDDALPDPVMVRTWIESTRLGDFS